MSSPAPGPNAFAAPGRYVLRLFAVCAAIVLSPPGVAAPGDLEAKIKAAYVFHVIKFVDWPTLPNDAVNLCVSGSDQQSDFDRVMAAGANGYLRKPVTSNDLRLRVESMLDTSARLAA